MKIKLLNLFGVAVFGLIIFMNGKFVAVEGNLVVIHNNHFNNIPQKEFLYFLNDGKELLKLRPVGDFNFAVPGARVVIKGFKSGGEFLFNAVGSSFKILEAKAELAQSLGPQKTLIVIYTYEDTPSDWKVLTNEQMKQFFIENVETFFDEESHSKISWPVLDVVSYGLPALGRDPNIPNGCSGVQWPLLGMTFENFFINFGGNNFNLENYNRLILVPHHPCFGGGFGSLGLNSWPRDYNFSVSWIGGVKDALNPSVIDASWLSYAIEHEFGHNLGVVHANGLRCNTGVIDSPDCEHVEYGNPFDVMGWRTFSDHFNAAFKDAFGWFNPGEVFEINRSGIYTIKPFENFSDSRAAKIQTPPMKDVRALVLENWPWISESDLEEFIEFNPYVNKGESYYLEYRREIEFPNKLYEPSWYPEAPWNLDGLLINWLPMSAYPATRLLDMSPEGITFDQGGNNWTVQALLKDANKSFVRFVDKKRGVIVGPIISNNDNGIIFRVDLLFPSELKATTSTNPNRINLEWFDNQDDEDFFEIERLSPGEKEFFSLIATVQKNGQIYSDSDIEEGIVYYYRVRSCKEGELCSLYSNIVSATIPLIAPNTPSGLNATATSPSQINLSWSDVLKEDKYKIERSTNNSIFTFVSSTILADTTTFSDTNLNENTTYYYRIMACNLVGCSVPGQVVSAKTFDGTPPSTPPNLSVSVGSSFSVDLSWGSSTDNVGVVGYKIYRNDIEIATTTETSYSDIRASFATRYDYSVSAYDARGNSSGQSKPVPILTRPTAPAFLYATFVSPARANLNWTDVSGETSYKIERSVDPGFSTRYNVVIENNLPADTMNYSDNTINPTFQNYYYRVSACNLGGCSFPSSPAAIQTSGTLMPINAPTLNLASCLSPGGTILIPKANLQKINFTKSGLATDLGFIGRESTNQSINFEVPQTISPDHSLEIYYSNQTEPTILKKC